MARFVGVDRAAIEVGDLDGMRGVGEIHHRDAALIPGLHQDVASGNRDQRSVVRHAVFKFGLRRRHLVVRSQRQLAVLQSEDGVRAPVHRIGRAATGLPAAAPFVREQHLGAVVAEVGGMPEGVIGIADRVDADRIHRIWISSRIPLPEHAPAARPSAE